MGGEREKRGRETYILLCKIAADTGLIQITCIMKSTKVQTLGGTQSS